MTWKRISFRCLGHGNQRTSAAGLHCGAQVALYVYMKIAIGQPHDFAACFKLLVSSSVSTGQSVASEVLWHVLLISPASWAGHLVASEVKWHFFLNSASYFALVRFPRSGAASDDERLCEGRGADQAG